MTTPKGPFRLVSVNTAPDRARRVIGRVADLLRDRYIIVHEANCESMYSALQPGQADRAEIADVGPTVTELMPDVLVFLSYAV
jgi:hypothetical protein